MNIVNLEDPIRVPYCGSKNTKPLIGYMPCQDLNVGDFCAH